MLRNGIFFCLGLLLMLLAGTRPAAAQELLAEVEVTAQNVAITDPQLINRMQKEIADFLNNRRWTNDVYKPEERIRCRLFIGINAIPQNGTYQVTARILSTRPVYGTAYETNLMSYAESWRFTYLPGQPLDFSENSYVNNLSSILGFYAYMIIGMDQDSFSPLGGSRYFDRARNILQVAAGQSADGDDGWKDNGKRDQRSRYWLLNGMQDPQLEALRSAVYAYYRQGLDIFIQKPDDARTSIFTALQGIQQANQRRPGSTLIRSFFETKADEIANIYRSSQSADQKQGVVALLQEVDPTNSAKYQAILQQR
ncbi:type IX secretion system protein PorD [Hymenobacter latericus]|uniref:type IX secretion system protein PorD n=1 Tax=Hymenobacter sp. YIM 151858-1 TaxID=2987688 RepID=UPI002227BF5C|nr:DUF4835 family protein [Hymenobacter sp. YIM 151858-1]UYZ57404.1 DUF4835 family protein [Hymenobacter sp. YIM 151858-1]